MVLYMVLWVLLLGGSVTSTTPRPAIEHSPRAGGQFHDLAITLLANSEARLKDKEYLPLEGEKFFVARFSCAEVVAPPLQLVPPSLVRFLSDLRVAVSSACSRFFRLHVSSSVGCGPVRGRLVPAP